MEVFIKVIFQNIEHFCFQMFFFFLFLLIWMFGFLIKLVKNEYQIYLF